MIYSNILKYCSDNHLAVSFGSSETLDEYFDVLPDAVPFVNATKEERLNPKLSLENCESVIMVGVPYEIFKRGNIVGILSQNSFYDYHKVVLEHLENIKALLEDDNAEAFVDTGKLFERGFALKYGLGFLGLNSFVINDKLGTYFNIGYVLTTKKFEVTETIKKTCYGCYKCVDVCPSGALKDGKCDMYKCVAYLTQKKDLLEPEEIKAMSNFLYGCDLCQKVCPHNKPIKLVKTDFNTDAYAFLEMEKEEFQKFEDYAFFWRGLPVMKRNAIYTIYNFGIPTEEKIEVFTKRLEVEKMELPKKALEQVLDLLKEV